MPVVAVVGGIASAGAGIAAWGAATGFAAVTAGLQIVGGIASVLGAVTGNEKLMKVGMVAGLGATAVSGLSSLSNASSVAEASGSSLMGQAPAGDYASFAAKNSAPVPDIVKNIGGEADALTTSSVADIASGTSPSATIQAAPMAQASAPAGMLASQGGTAPKIPQIGAQGPQGEMSFMGGIGKFANENPGTIKLATGILGGFGQAYAEQEKIKSAERMDADKRKRLDTSITAIRSTY